MKWFTACLLGLVATLSAQQPGPTTRPVCYDCLMWTPRLPLPGTGFPKLTQISTSNTLPLKLWEKRAADACRTDFFIDFEIWGADNPPSDRQIAQLKAEFDMIAAHKRPGVRFGWYTFGGSFDPRTQTYDAKGVEFAERIKRSGLLDHVDFLCSDWYYFSTSGNPPSAPSNPWEKNELDVWEIVALNKCSVAKAVGKPLVLLTCPRCVAMDYSLKPPRPYPASGLPVDLNYFTAQQRFAKALIDRGDLWMAGLWDWNDPRTPVDLRPLMPYVNAAKAVYQSGR